MQIKEIPVIKMDDFSQVDTDEKLNLIMVAINKINTNFHHKFQELHDQLNDPKGGICTRITACEEKVNEIHEAINDEDEGVLPCLRDAESSIVELQDLYDQVQEKLELMENNIVILRGAAQVQEKQITSNRSKITDLTARSMSHNIVIFGLLGDNKEENCKEKVIEFMKQLMKITDLKDQEVVVAHRLGNKTTGQLRPIVVRCEYTLRNRVFDYVKNLKGIKNQEENYYSVRQLLAEPIFTK